MNITELNEEFFRDHEVRAEMGAKMLGQHGAGDFVKRARPEDSIAVAQKWIWGNQLDMKKGFKQLMELWRKTGDDACKHATLEFQYILFSEKYGADFPGVFDPVTVQVARDELARW